MVISGTIRCNSCGDHPSLRVIILFYRNILRTSAVSSTNFGSILIFASCVVLVLVIYYVGEFFHYGRSHIVLLRNKHIYIRVDYIGYIIYNTT